MPNPGGKRRVLGWPLWSQDEHRQVNQQSNQKPSARLASILRSSATSNKRLHAVRSMSLCGSFASFLSFRRSLRSSLPASSSASSACSTSTSLSEACPPGSSACADAAQCSLSETPFVPLPQEHRDPEELGVAMQESQRPRNFGMRQACLKCRSHSIRGSLLQLILQIYTNSCCWLLRLLTRNVCNSWATLGADFFWHLALMCFLAIGSDAAAYACTLVKGTFDVENPLLRPCKA